MHLLSGSRNPAGAPVAPKPAAANKKSRTSTSPGMVARMVQQLSTFNGNAARTRAEHLRESGNNPGNLPLNASELAATAFVAAAGAGALGAAPRLARAQRTAPPAAPPGPTSAQSFASLNRLQRAQGAIRNATGRAASGAGAAHATGVAPSRPPWRHV